MDTIAATSAYTIVEGNGTDTKDAGLCGRATAQVLKETGYSEEEIRQFAAKNIVVLG